MSSLHPLESANRLLAIDQPFLQGPPHSSNIGYGATESREPNQFNQYNHDGKDHTITTIYEHLKNLEKRAAKSEANQEAQSNAFETVHQKLVELDHRWDVVIDRENPDCLGAVFDPLFDLGTGMAENSFHSAMMRQQGKLINQEERMALNQLQTTKDVMEQLDLMHNAQSDRHEYTKGEPDDMHDVQSSIMGRLKHVHEVNVEQHKTLRAKLEDFSIEQKDLENCLMGKLDRIHTNLEEQEINFLEKSNYLDEGRSEVENNLTERLDNIHNELENQKISLMEKMDYVEVEQENALPSQSQWSVLVYGSQDRIIDRSEMLEKKIR